MNKKYSYPCVLSIAGFDGSGGAGIQADIKTISALGCFATTVLTALPVQNTQGLRSVFPIPDQVVREQISAVIEDIFPAAIKIGMVPTAAQVSCIVQSLSRCPGVPVVFDPVMMSSSGHQLIEDKTMAAMIDLLFPVVTMITPNMDEAGLLAGMDINTVDDMYVAGERIMKMSCASLLLKGGHLNAPELSSLYFAADGTVYPFVSKRTDTRNTHGTGCTLSSAIASYIARGFALKDAVLAAQQYVQLAIEYGKDVVIGKGRGPLNHFFDPHKLILNELSDE